MDFTTFAFHPRFLLRHPSVCTFRRSSSPLRPPASFPATPSPLHLRLSPPLRLRLSPLLRHPSAPSSCLRLWPSIPIPPALSRNTPFDGYPLSCGDNLSRHKSSPKLSSKSDPKVSPKLSQKVVTMIFTTLLTEFIPRRSRQSLHPSCHQCFYQRRHRSRC